MPPDEEQKPDVEQPPKAAKPTRTPKARVGSADEERKLIESDSKSDLLNVKNLDPATMLTAATKASVAVAIVFAATVIFALGASITPVGTAGFELILLLGSAIVGMAIAGALGLFAWFFVGNGQVEYEYKKQEQNFTMRFTLAFAVFAVALFVWFGQLSYQGSTFWEGVEPMLVKQIEKMQSKSIKSDKHGVNDLLDNSP